MDANDTARTTDDRLRVHALLSALIFLIGVGLLVYMIRVEGEPGALPLGLIAVGIAWNVATRVRRRALQG